MMTYPVRRTKPKPGAFINALDDALAELWEMDA